MAAAVIGREDERNALDALFDHSEAGLSALVLEGEAGIGKTMLWLAGVEHARDRGYRVLSCRPSEVERSLPFAALGDLLEPVVEDSGPALSDPMREALEVALLQRAPPAEPIERLALWRAVLAILRALVLVAPVLLAIDDVQWLDASTAAAFTFALRRLGESPLRVLVSQRSSEEADLLGLEDGPRLRRLGIGPLGADEIEQLVANRLGGELTPPMLARLHRSSGGNPYLALEIVEALQRGGGELQFGRAVPAPESIAALLRARIGSLSEEAREALLLAAAALQPTLSLLEAITGSSAAVRELLDAGILEVEGERLRFAHPLLASVAYSAADPEARRDVHSRLAVASRDAEERALHLAEATDRADAKAAAELDHAAVRAFRRGAPAAAGELADHARRLTPPEQTEALWERTVRSAEYHLAAGETARGRDLLERTVEHLLPGHRRAKLLLRLGQIRYTVDDVATARALFEQALAEAGDDDAIRTVGEHGLAFTAMFGGDMHSALAHARTSLDVAERLGDPGFLALALAGVSLQELLSGSGLDRARIERAVLLEEYVNEVPVEWTPTYVYAGLAMFTDQLELSRELHARVYRSVVERGDERALPAPLFAMSRLECAAGDWVLARRYATEAVARSKRTGQAAVCANALSAQALVNALVGDAVAARDAAAEGIEIAMRAGAQAPLAWITAAVGFLELSLSDPAAAHAQLGPLTALVVAGGLGEPGVVRFLPDEIEALIALGDFDASETLLLLLEQRGQALDRISARAAAARCRALLHAGRGDIAQARKSVSEALAQHARLDEPFELGRTLLVAGTIERRAKARANAREELTQALELFDALGAALWAEKAATELARIPARVPPSSELSQAERRVAELVADGLSNKEVAAKLFVTVRAVEANLSKIYAKLGLRSRTELAKHLRAG